MKQLWSSVGLCGHGFSYCSGCQSAVGAGAPIPSHPIPIPPPQPETGQLRVAPCPFLPCGWGHKMDLWVGPDQPGPWLGRPGLWGAGDQLFCSISGAGADSPGGLTWDPGACVGVGIFGKWGSGLWCPQDPEIRPWTIPIRKGWMRLVLLEQKSALWLQALQTFFSWGLSSSFSLEWKINRHSWDIMWTSPVTIAVACCKVYPHAYVQITES